MALRIFLWLLTALPITAHAEAPPPIDGWGKLKFGMSVQEAIDAMPEAALHTIAECTPEEIAQNGCLILSSSTKKYRVIIEGLPFEIKAHTDRFNRLHEVRLQFSELEGVTPETCKSYWVRALEGLERRYGALRFIPESPAEQAKKQADGYVFTEHKTEAGSVYIIQTRKQSPTYTTFHSMYNDMAAAEEYRANAERDSTDYRTEMRASRPFLWLNGGGVNGYCDININYIAATMPKPEGAESGDTGAF